MSLNAALSLFLEEYPKAVQRSFAGDAVAEFIRNDVTQTLATAIGPNPRYVVSGSPGQGNWAKVPWAAVYDRFITNSAQDGYYVVYLVKEDFSGVYLSLNQGVTSVKKRYGSEAKAALRVRAADFLARLGSQADGLEVGAIDLAATRSAGLGAYYQAGAICSKFYAKGAIPADDALAADLHQFINLYFLLASSEAQLFERADAEEDEAGLDEEDLRVLREHKRIDRNQKLAHNAKQALGYVCKACGFDFQSKYGAIGFQFIEAHHLTPLAELKGQRLTLDPKRDFTVLCANCHRMIHRTALVGCVEEFRAQYVIKDEPHS